MALPHTAPGGSSLLSLRSCAPEQASCGAQLRQDTHMWALTHTVDTPMNTRVCAHTDIHTQRHSHTDTSQLRSITTTRRALMWSTVFAGVYIQLCQQKEPTVSKTLGATTKETMHTRSSSTTAPGTGGRGAQPCHFLGIHPPRKCSTTCFTHNTQATLAI